VREGTSVLNTRVVLREGDVLISESVYT
jgi:hypothetical protein